MFYNKENQMCRIVAESKTIETCKRLTEGKNRSRFRRAFRPKAGLTLPVRKRNRKGNQVGRV